jgi:hypothetical protein
MKNDHIPSQEEILETLRQARAYRLEAEAEIRRQIAVLDIIEAVYGVDISPLPERDKVIE